MIRTPAAARSAAEALLSGDFVAIFSLEFAWFELGKKICCSNVATAETMEASFTRSEVGVPSIEESKRSQLWTGLTF